MKKIIFFIALSVAAVRGMCQTTDVDLTTQMNVIGNETVAGANTKTRIAAAFQALVDSKISGQDWITSTAYTASKSFVIQSNILYKCLISHTAGTFATDLAASRWVAISNSGGGGGSVAFADITGAAGDNTSLAAALALKAALISPSFTTPTLGVATATSVNKVAFTAPATSATLTIADGKTATVSNTLTFAGTDASTLNIGAGGTLGSNAFTSTAYSPMVPAFTTSTANQSSYTLAAGTHYEITSNQATVSIALGGGTASSKSYCTFGYNTTVVNPAITFTTTNTTLAALVDGTISTVPITFTASTSGRYECFITYTSTTITTVICTRVIN